MTENDSSITGAASDTLVALPTPAERKIRLAEFIHDQERNTLAKIQASLDELKQMYQDIVADIAETENA